MILRGIDFGSVWDASGVRNFFGEGYPFHRAFKSFGLNFDGSTYGSETDPTNLGSGGGDMPLHGTMPRKLKPDCIVVKHRHGAVLNAVGLSGPGAEALFGGGRWQKRKKPFFLSFMAVGATLSKRLDELNGFMRLCDRHLPEFRAKVGIQLNLSCPNTSHGASDDVGEAKMMLAHLGIPIVPKFSVTTPVETVARIAEHPACDAVTVSNTVPWPKIAPDERERIFGTQASPLEKYGGGGLSGAPLLPLVMDWLEEAQHAGFPKPIAAGGGILRTVDGQQLFHRGADAVCLGSIAILRPWRVWHTVQTLKIYGRLSR